MTATKDQQITATNNAIAAKQKVKLAILDNRIKKIFNALLEGNKKALKKERAKRVSLRHAAIATSEAYYATREISDLIAENDSMMYDVDKTENEQGETIQ